MDSDGEDTWQKRATWSSFPHDSNLHRTGVGITHQYKEGLGFPGKTIEGLKREHHLTSCSQVLFL